MSTDVVRETQQALEAMQVLRAQIADLAAGDEGFITDTLEGETDLPGMVRALLASIGEDEAMAEGLTAYRDELSTRLDRFKDRAGVKRALIASALEIAGRKSVETDVGTVSLTKVQPKAIIGEEADIPTEFWKPQAPKLDRTKITAALKEGREVPGATLSNGGVTVTIRRK